MYIFITSNADKFVDSFPWSLGLRVLERQDTELSEDSFNFFRKQKFPKKSSKNFFLLFFSKKNFWKNFQKKFSIIFCFWKIFQKKIRKNVQKNNFLEFFWIFFSRNFYFPKKLKISSESSVSCLSDKHNLNGSGQKLTKLSKLLAIATALPVSDPLKAPPCTSYSHYTVRVSQKFEHTSSARNWRFYPKLWPTNWRFFFRFF